MNAACGWSEVCVMPANKTQVAFYHLTQNEFSQTHRGSKPVCYKQKEDAEWRKEGSREPEQEVGHYTVWSSFIMKAG